MGVWGPGNFDGDYSRDYLADMVGRWERVVDALLAGEIPQELASHDLVPGLDTCEMCVMPTVEVMIVVAEHLKPDYLPPIEVIGRWRSEYLGLFDRDCAQWDASRNIWPSEGVPSMRHSADCRESSSAEQKVAPDCGEKSGSKSRQPPQQLNLSVLRQEFVHQ